MRFWADFKRAFWYGYYKAMTQPMLDANERALTRLQTAKKAFLPIPRVRFRDARPAPKVLPFHVKRG